MRHLLLLLFLVLAIFSIARAQQTNNNPLGELDAPGAPPSTTPAPAPAPAGTAQQAQTAATTQTLQESARMINEENYDGALSKLNALIQTDPRNISAFVLRGQIFSKKKMWDKAANDFQSAHLIDPQNPVANFDVAEIKFAQKSYDAARIGFVELARDPTTLIGELASYKVFLCDLMGNHMDVAAKEFDAFNQIGSGASFYYASAAWSLVHHQTEDARSWLASASHIYSPQKNGLYRQSLTDLGLLPLPPPPSPQ